MATLFERIKAAVPGAIFYPGATEEQIGRVEGAMGVRFPAWLRELYLCCNGIQDRKFGDPYLYALEKSDDFPHSLLSWNEFIRNSWQEYAPQYKESFPETDWDFYNPRHLLLLGGANAQDWATDLRENSTVIVWYDVQDPERRTVLGADLAEVCFKERLQMEEIHRQIYCGRARHRWEADPLPAATDVEFILDALVEICRGSRSSSLHMRESSSPGWSLYRGISQREGEGGMLFVFTRGGSSVQVATVNGNLPFVIRTKLEGTEPVRCVVKDLPEAMICFLSVMDSNYWSARESEEGRRGAEVVWRTLWKHRYGPEVPALERMADVLFERDDRRLGENAPIGD